MENELRPAFGIRAVLAQERWMYGNISFGTCLPTSQGNKVNAILQGLCLGEATVGKQFDTLVANLVQVSIVRLVSNPQKQKSTHMLSHCVSWSGFDGRSMSQCFPEIMIPFVHLTHPRSSEFCCF
jgi:hypothetical protein